MSLWCCGRERCALRLYIRAFFCSLFAGSWATSILVSSPARAQSQPGQWLPEITVSNPSRRAAEPVARPSPGPTAQQGGSGSTQGAGTGNNPVPESASEGVVSGTEINAIPISRPAEILENVPGLVITQHSGEGKANQYFLRGFNLDHGTDLAIWLDGMPINMRTHGHGQGYADLNFLIPELVGSMFFRKGPYYADEGDFSSAGAVHLNLLDKLPKNLIQGTYGSFGYWRGLSINSTPVGPGNLLTAFELNRYDGPWDVPDRIRKYNGVARYSQGTNADGFSVTAMAYQNHWTSTDQVPQRAIDQNLITRYGTLNPTDGGEASRQSLSMRWSSLNPYGATRLEAYAIHSTLKLYNDFTYFLDNPTYGDQFSQSDRRTLAGGQLSHVFKGSIGGVRTDTKIGLQTRYDDIDVALGKTYQRTPLSTVRDDRVGEGSVSAFAENTAFWTPWFRSVLGYRVDWFRASVDSDLAANSGKSSASMGSPKASLIFGPVTGTELFLNAGTGLHSNDARGTTITIDPVTGDPLSRAPLLVRSKGAEVGLKSKAITNLESSLALFVLDFNSELIFVGDAGTTEASRPSRRVGVEWTNRYKVNSWLAFDADLAVTRARFKDYDPAGNYIPGAPAVVFTSGVIFGEEFGWFGAMKLRYFGERPLIEDGSVRSLPSTVVNARLGYKFTNGTRIQLDALNLFNTKTNQIEYYYESQLAGEPAPVADRHVHPIEPFQLRLTLAAQF
jgi:outer membrane receptor protein involved in Fe transport